MIESPDRSQARNILRQKAKLEAIITYLTSVGIEKYLLERIVKYKPDLVFVGDSYAQGIYRKRDELESRHGIKIEEYWRDVIAKDIGSKDLMLAAKACDEHLTREKLLEDKIELQKVESPEQLGDDLQRMQIERYYSSVTKGRVTDKTPDYIGSWDLDFEERGLFEVFVRQRSEENGVASISGIIEDCNGSADFQGRMEKNSIVFFKRYTKAALCAAKGEIHYTGVLQKDGKYLGTFCGLSCSIGNFWMEPFKKE